MFDIHIERGGIKLHVVDKEKAISILGADRLNELRQIPGSDYYISNSGLTFGQMADWCLGSTPYDTAIPEGSGYIPGVHVWYYPQGSAMGQPYNVTATFWLDVKERIAAAQ